MKHLSFYFIAAALLSGCVSLTTPEQADLRRLEAQGVTTLSPQSETINERELIWHHRLQESEK